MHVAITLARQGYRVYAGVRTEASGGNHTIPYASRFIIPACVLPQTHCLRYCLFTHQGRLVDIHLSCCTRRCQVPDSGGFRCLRTLCVGCLTLCLRAWWLCQADADHLRAEGPGDSDLLLPVLLDVTHIDEINKTVDLVAAVGVVGRAGGAVKHAAPPSSCPCVCGVVFDGLSC